ncbi:MAG: hypothetical protein R3310_14670 [Candidatus Competibacteraceae bacterium]|nr:hypothetical protein [Candidatus Competibacteraceae bacterium]
MPDIIGQFHLDHGNIACLFNLLEGQLDILERQDRPDYDLVLDIMYYIILLLLLLLLPATALADQDALSRQLEQRLEFRQRQWQREALGQPPLPDPRRRQFREELRDAREQDLAPSPPQPLTSEQRRQQALEELRRQREYDARRLEAKEPYVKPRRPQPEFELEFRR